MRPRPLEEPPRLRWALLPTRIERLSRYSAALPGVEVWIKRDDQSGFLLSGNKVRKLEYSLAAALAEGVDGVITCGGFNSNHCRAAALLAARLGLECHLLLRTADGGPPRRLQGNTLLDRLAGARIRWITPEEYRHRTALMAEHRDREALAGRRLACIPEGASDAIGSFGYVSAVVELQEQLRAKNLRVEWVVHATGSGGTAAGLSAGRARHDASWRLLTYTVCDDESYFREKIGGIRADLEAYGLPRLSAEEGIEIVDRYKGRGYGLTTPAELRWIRDFCREEGILLDPCYTGKAFYGLHQEILAGRFAPGSRILFLHTGGGFGNFAYEDEWGEALDELS
ncbi:MAG: 1-aminocyclopropane-1-carboxylate deaminase/D-cysteine desulfhydrase [Planctomycetota bacterium]